MGFIGVILWKRRRTKTRRQIQSTRFFKIQIYKNGTVNKSLSMNLSSRVLSSRNQMELTVKVEDSQWVKCFFLSWGLLVHPNLWIISLGWLQRHTSTSWNKDPIITSFDNWSSFFLSPSPSSQFLFKTSQKTVVTYDGKSWSKITNTKQIMNLLSDTWSLGDKAQFAKSSGMAGCFTWSLDQVLYCSFLPIPTASTIDLRKKTNRMMVLRYKMPFVRLWGNR